MGLLTDRRILITGVLSTRSIAYGVAKACQREGATLAFTYANDDLRERVVKIAAEFGPCPVLACNVASDDDIAALVPSALGHRIFFTPVYELRRAQIADALIAQILEKVATPRS